MVRLSGIGNQGMNQMVRINHTKYDEEINHGIN